MTKSEHIRKIEFGFRPPQTLESDMTQTERAIARSVSHNEIVHLEYDIDAINSLLALCDDSADTETTHEYWGTDDDGNQWRVHVAVGSPAERWWSWHDADSSRAYSTMEEAEEACDAWVEGNSDVGPSR